MPTYREACKCPEKKSPDRKVSKKDNRSNSQKTSKGARGSKGVRGEVDAKTRQERPKVEPKKLPCITGQCGKTGKKGKSTKK
jgi:hypothetical protein